MISIGRKQSLHSAAAMICSLLCTAQTGHACVCDECKLRQRLPRMICCDCQLTRCLRLCLMFCCLLHSVRGEGGYGSTGIKRLKADESEPATNGTNGTTH